MKIGDIDEKDKKFWRDKPDVGFSPKRNKFIIDQTIKKYEMTRARKMKVFVNKLGERSQAAAFYLKHLTQGKSTGVDKYFGKRMLAKLQGKNIVDEYKRRAGISTDLKRKVIMGEGLDVKHGKKSKKRKKSV